MSNNKTPKPPTPNAPPLAKEQTDSRSMLDNLIRGYEQNISKPMVGSLIDMTLGLGDLGQMGTKYLANRAGIKTNPFVSTAEPAKAAAGVTGYDPYTIGGIATNLLPFARGKQLVGDAARTFASMFPNLGREALSYAGGEAGAAAAREVLPDSTSAQLLASLAGSVAGGVGGSPTMSNMAAKNEGGNWIKGSIEERLKGLKLKYNGSDPQIFVQHLQERLDAEPNSPVPAAFTNTLAELKPKAAINNWVDKQLTDYVQNKMSTPTDTLRIMADKYAEEKPALLAAAQAKIDALYAKGDRIARERGVPRESLTQHRQDEIAAEKAKALIEARQPLHFDAKREFENTYGNNADPNYYYNSINKHKREDAGLPVEGYGVSDIARMYERLTDDQFSSNSARSLLTEDGTLFNKSANELLQDNPWLQKLPQNTPVYDFTESSSLNFDHLIDELSNATNPNSGLPKELLIDFKDLPKITMEQAVNRVADINAWRSVNRAEANFALANNPATFVHKQYPDGMKWVQIKRPEDLPEGWTVDKAGKTISPEGNYAEDPRETAVSDALKYEGDTMINCVGGYCDRVLEGKSEIFSLRNAEGQPFATIEVQPQSEIIYYNNLGPNAQRRFMERAVEYRRQTVPNWNRLISDGERLEMFRNYIQAQNIKIPLTINQIKGMNNGAVEEKYWPLVQDFINSGTWNEVKEYRNAGLTEDANGRYVLKAEQAEKLASGGSVTKKAKGGNVERVYNDRKYI